MRDDDDHDHDDDDDDDDNDDDLDMRMSRPITGGLRDLLCGYLLMRAASRRRTSEQPRLRLLTLERRRSLMIVLLDHSGHRLIDYHERTEGTCH